MKRHRYTTFFATGAGTVLLGLLLAGCGNSPNTTSTTNCTATATTTTQSTALVGTIASIDTAKDTFTVNNTVTRAFTTAGTITVSYTSAPATPTASPTSTTFLQQSTSTASALTTGSIIQVDVNANAGTPIAAPTTGIYQAAAIAIVGTGQQAGAGRNRRTGTPRTSTTGCPRPSPAAGIGLANANVKRFLGLISTPVTQNPDGTVTLTITQGRIVAGNASPNASTYTINTSASTSITQLKSIDATALQIGQPVSIGGTKSGNSELIARSVTILLALPTTTPAA